MMMNIREKRLAIAVAGAVSLVASTAQAEDFTASATLQNTLTVVNLQNLDVGTVFATETGANYVNGVGALTISPSGAVTYPTDGVPSLTSLTTPVAAQGSVAMTADFFLTLPDTSGIVVGDFVTNAGDVITGPATELVHESLNPAVPSLYLMHFTVDAVSGGMITEGTPNLGDFSIDQDFGETEFVFNIGGTLTTEPNDSGTAVAYQEGVYSGTFAVTAAY